MYEVIKEFTLSDGRTAKITRAKGKHLATAYRTANNKEDKMEVYTILISQVVLIDDKPVVPEDVEELDLRDYNKLMEEFGDLGF